MTTVASGERPVSWGVSGYRALEARTDGDPIDLIYWSEGMVLAAENGEGGIFVLSPDAGAANGSVVK